MLSIIISVMLLASGAYAGSGCKGISCGTNCCDPKTQNCITPQGFRPSYCTSTGRHLLRTSENMWTKNIRVGFITIKKVNNYDIKNLTNILDGHIVNATILDTKSLHKRNDIKNFFKPGKTVLAMLIKNSFTIEEADTIFKKNSKLITGFSFCPIDDNNVITLDVRINKAMTHNGHVNKNIDGVELTVVIKKNNDKSRYDWTVVVRDSKN